MRRLLYIGLGAALVIAPLAACKRVDVASMAEAEAAKGAEKIAGADADAAKNAAAGQAWLADNAKQAGVVTLPSGAQYKIVKSGPATGLKPKPADEIKIHYEGKLTTGSVFDSSYDRGTPTTFRLGGLIPGWVEVLQLMRPGDEWMLYLPPELAYGPESKTDDEGVVQIPAMSVLVFKIELIDVLPSA